MYVYKPISLFHFTAFIRQQYRFLLYSYIPRFIQIINSDKVKRVKYLIENKQRVGLPLLFLLTLH